MEPRDKIGKRTKGRHEVKVEKEALELCEDKAGEMQPRTEGRFQFHSKWEPELSAYV